MRTLASAILVVLLLTLLFALIVYENRRMSQYYASEVAYDLFFYISEIKESKFRKVKLVIPLKKYNLLYKPELIELSEGILTVSVNGQVFKLNTQAKGNLKLRGLEGFVEIVKEGDEVWVRHSS